MENNSGASSRDVDSPILGGVDDNDVAVVDAELPPSDRVPLSRGQRRRAALVLRQPARRASGPVHDPRRRHIVFRLPPFEVEPLRVTGPAGVVGRIADEIGPAHDAVYGQRKRTGGGLRLDERSERDEGQACRGKGLGHAFHSSRLLNCDSLR